MLPVLFSLKGKGGQLCMLFSNILCLDIRLIYGKLCWSVCHKIHNSSVNADGSGRWKGLWNHDDIYFILKHKPKYKKNSFISFEFLNMCNNQRISCIMYIVFELYTYKKKKKFLCAFISVIKLYVIMLFWHHNEGLIWAHLCRLQNHYKWTYILCMITNMQHFL